MERQYHQWFSPRLGFDMGLVSYGHYGTPLLAFPTSGGDEWEMEGQGMIRTLSPYIEQGRIKVFGVRSVSDASFYNRGAHPFHRSWMQKQYDEYIRWEVVPFIHDHCKGIPPIAVMGASLGAYHAANSAFKHPDTFKWCFALSGVYDMRRFMDGMYDDNFYFNNPIDYLGCDHRSLVLPADRHLARASRHRLRRVGEARGDLPLLRAAASPQHPAPPR